MAAAELEAEQIGYPIRRILRSRRNVSFVLGRVEELDLQAKTLRTESQTMSYDYLILALGSSSTFFNIPGADTYTFPLKTMEDGIALRNHILRCFEMAAQEPNAAERQRLLTFVVVGGGPTGVEYAGALAELIYGPLAKDYRDLDVTEVSLVLVEMGGRLLAGMPEKLGRYAEARLRKMGVQLFLETAVTEVTADHVCFQNGSGLPTRSVVWTAGVRGHPLAERWGLPVGRDGRVAVAPTLQLPGEPNVYIIGDMAAFAGEDGRPLPMLAPVAMQQGSHAAANIRRQIADRNRSLSATSTRARWPRLTERRGRPAGRRLFTGFIAWIVWLVVHLFQLIGYRNRLVVLINWAWSYLFFERAVRLILPVGRGRRDAPEESVPYG